MTLIITQVLIGERKVARGAKGQYYGRRSLCVRPSTFARPKVIHLARAVCIFTGALDKVTDDVTNRICRENNKPLGSDDPGVKCNQS